MEVQADQLQMDKGTILWIVTPAIYYSHGTPLCGCSDTLTVKFEENSLPAA